MDLQKLINASIASMKKMTPAQLADMRRAQMESYGRAEAGFGSDADEAAYSAALSNGDPQALQRLNAESDVRVQEYKRLRRATLLTKGNEE